MVGKWFTVPSFVVIALGAVQFRAILANGNSPRSGDEKDGKDGIKYHLNLFVAWIERPQFRGMVIDQILTSIYKRFQTHGVEIPYPKRDLYVKEWPSSPAP